MQHHILNGNTHLSLNMPRKALLAQELQDLSARVLQCSKMAAWVLNRVLQLS